MPGRITPPTVNDLSIISTNIMPWPVFFSAERVIQGTNVSVKVTPPTGSTNYVVQEILPVGVTPQNLDQGGVWDAASQTIQWGPFVDDQPRTLNYSACGSGLVSGTIQSQNGGYGWGGPIIMPYNGTTNLPMYRTMTGLSANSSILPGGCVATSVVNVVSKPERCIAYWPGYNAMTVGATALVGCDGKAGLFRSIFDRYITIQVTPIPGATGYTVVEVLPDGLSPAYYDQTVQWDAGTRTLTWGPFTNDVPQTLSYGVDGPSGTYAVSGSGIFSDGTVAIAGDSTISFYVEPVPLAIRYIYDSNVTVVVTPPFSTNVYSLIETLPDGLSPVNLDTNGQWDATARTITWGPFSGDQAGQFFYSVSGTNGFYQVEGVVVMDGTNSPVTGDQNVSLWVYADPATRTIQGKNISITVNPWAWVTNYTVQEYLPNGVVPQDIGQAGQWDADTQTITWGPFTDTQSRTLTYSACGSGLLNGSLSDASDYWSGGGDVTIYKAGNTPDFYQPVMNSSIIGASALMSCDGKAGLYRTIFDREVTIQITPAPGVTAYTVEEVVPAELTAWSSDALASWDDANHKLVWGPFSNAEPQTLSYQVDGPAGTYQASGTGVFADGAVAIGGDATFELVDWPIVMPLAYNVNLGDPATLKLQLGGTNAFQWLLNGLPLTGQTGLVLNLPAINSNLLGNYSVIISNLFGVTTSTVAQLTTLLRPIIAGQPVNSTVTLGTNATFTVTATGDALSFQWSKNGMTIPGATNAVLNLTNIHVSDLGRYTVLIKNALGSLQSAPAILDVKNAPSLNVTPFSTNILAGGTLKLNIKPDGTPPLKYYWLHNGRKLTGQTGSTLLLSGLTTNQMGNYSVVISNAVGVVTNFVASLRVMVKPVIILAPRNQFVELNNTATFTVTAVGSAPLVYQWRKDNADLVGETSDTLVLSNVQTNDQGRYSVRITNAVGTATSAAAILRIQQPPAVTVQPTNQSVIAGTTVQFKTAVSGTPPFTYHWRYADHDPTYDIHPMIYPWYAGTVLPGQRSPVLTLPMVGTNHAGYYAVVVSNAVGAVISPWVRLQVTPRAVVLNYFKSLKGEYNGLFRPPITHDTNGAAIVTTDWTNSGTAKVFVNEKGTFTGLLSYQGKPRPFSGAFETNGAALVAVKVDAATTLRLAMNFQANEAALTGAVSQSGGWTAELWAGQRSLTKTEGYKGIYNVGLGEITNVQGVLSFNVLPAGVVVLSGTLTDGTIINSVSGLDTNGDWVFNQSLYGGKGMLLGRIHCATTGAGEVHWQKVVDGKETNGFSMNPPVQVSRYTAPASNQTVTVWTNGILTAQGDNLAPVTAEITVARNKVTIIPGAVTLTNLSVYVEPRTGQILGSFLYPPTKKTVLFRGVVVQSYTGGTLSGGTGLGCFLNANYHGTVSLQTTNPPVVP